MVGCVTGEVGWCSGVISFVSSVLSFDSCGLSASTFEVPSITTCFVGSADDGAGSFGGAAVTPPFSAFGCPLAAEVAVVEEVISGASNLVQPAASVRGDTVKIVEVGEVILRTQLYNFTPSVPVAGPVLNSCIRTE